MNFNTCTNCNFISNYCLNEKKNLKIWTNQFQRIHQNYYAVTSSANKEQSHGCWRCCCFTETAHNWWIWCRKIEVNDDSSTYLQMMKLHFLFKHFVSESIFDLEIYLDFIHNHQYLKLICYSMFPCSLMLRFTEDQFEDAQCTTIGNIFHTLHSMLTLIFPSFRSGF